MEHAPNSLPQVSAPHLTPHPGLMGHLVRRGIISGDAAIDTLRHAAEQGRSVADLLLTSGVITGETLLSHRAAVAGLP